MRALDYALIAAARTGRLTLPRDDGSPEAARFRDELAACSASLVSGGRLTWGNERGHDDYVASLALCLHAAETAGSPPHRHRPRHPLTRRVRCAAQQR